MYEDTAQDQRDSVRNAREMEALDVLTKAADRWFAAGEAVEAAQVGVAQAKTALSAAEQAQVEALHQRNRDIREAFRANIIPDVIAEVMSLSRTMVYRILGG
jgi:hypothetical protein